MRYEACVVCEAPARKLLVASSGAQDEDGSAVYDIALDFCDYCAQDEGVMIMEIERAKQRMAKEAKRKADPDLCDDCGHEPVGGKLRPEAARNCPCWCHFGDGASRGDWPF